MNTCENCGREIGRLETPCVWKEHILCNGCYSSLTGQSKKAVEAAQYARTSERERIGFFGIWFRVIAGIVLTGILVFGVLVVIGIFSAPKNPFPMSGIKELASPITPVASATLNVEYDKFKDSTSISTGYSIEEKNPKWRLQPISGSDDVPSYIGFSCNFSHQTITETPPFIDFMFTSDASIAHNNDDPEIIFLADGNRIIGRVLFAGEYVTSVVVSTQDSVALANAKDVEVKILGQDLKITSDQLHALAGFLKSIGVQ